MPDAQRDQLARYLAECATSAPQFRWTPAANLHLTVRFLGHLERSVAETIADRFVGARPTFFDIELGEVGAFQRGRLAKVVWMGLRTGEAQTAALAAKLEAECVRAGLEPESRRYHPHLTLARARARDGAALPDLPVPPSLDAWRARELILYRSLLGRGGASSEYEPLRRISLG